MKPIPIDSPWNFMSFGQNKCSRDGLGLDFQVLPPQKIVRQKITFHEEFVFLGRLGL